MNSQQILNGAIQQVGEITKELATARSEYENLEEQKKVILATIATEVEAKTESERNRLALSSPDYLEYLAGLAEANTRYRAAQARMNALTISVDAARTINASNRLEINTNSLIT